MCVRCEIENCTNYIIKYWPGLRFLQNRGINGFGVFDIYDIKYNIDIDLFNFQSDICLYEHLSILVDEIKIINL